METRETLYVDGVQTVQSCTKTYGNELEEGASKENSHLYRRNLPPTCIPFSSDDGKRLFTEALLSGYANSYFALAEQFRTQDEPAYCGLSTLVMVLNALAVDPKKIWRGPWRWYFEDMLSCCFPENIDEQKGTTIGQFVRLAVCNNLDLNVVLVCDDASINDFRKTVMEICSGQSHVLTCCYSRRALGQSGHGHFTPIGAYHPEKDLILVLDVERYKYPPHWIPIESMWKAMRVIEKVTGLPRGYIVMRKTIDMPLLLFRLSTTFRVTIATHNLLQSPMTAFVTYWRSFLNQDTKCDSSVDSLEGVVTKTLELLQEALAVFVEGESMFATQFETCCVNDLPADFVESVKVLVEDLNSTQLFKVVDAWVTRYKEDGKLRKPPCGNIKVCAKRVCCRLQRIGKSVDDIEEYLKDMKIDRQCTKDKRKRSVGCSDSKEKPLVHESHYISMLLLSWPYELETMPGYVQKLMTYVRQITGQCNDILQNEISQLKNQILSLISMVENHEEKGLKKSPQ